MGLISELGEKSNRVESQKVTELGKESNRVEPKLTKKQKSVLDFCMEVPRSGQEILAFVGVSYQTKNIRQYVNKLVESGKLRPTKQKENDPDRKYVTAKL